MKRTMMLTVAVTTLLATAQTPVIDMFGKYAMPTPVLSLDDFGLKGDVKLVVEKLYGDDGNRKTYTFANRMLVESSDETKTPWNDGSVIDRVTYLIGNGNRCDTIIDYNYSVGNDLFGNRETSESYTLNVLSYNDKGQISAIREIPANYINGALVPKGSTDDMACSMYVPHGSTTPRQNTRQIAAEYFYGTNGALSEIYDGRSRAADGRGAYYFANGRLKSVDTKKTVVRSLNEAVLTYDAAGRLVKAVEVVGGTDASYKQTTTIVYNTKGLPAKITVKIPAYDSPEGWQAASTTVTTITYAYDTVGNWIKRTETQGRGKNVIIRDITYQE